MATDEKRRLIYELIVEAVDLKKSTDAAATELKKVSTSAGDMALGVKRAFAALGIAASLKAIFSQSAEMQKFNASIKEVGASFADAAIEASGLMDALNDPSTVQVWKDEAIKLGNALGWLAKQAKAGYDALTDPLGGQSRSTAAHP